MRIICKTLTPLWLGDIDRNSRLTKESGFLGSLRYWYEGILRSAGARVCSPAAGRCQEDPCQACAFFGFTGRARAFDLSIEGLKDLPVWFQIDQTADPTDYDWLRGAFRNKRALWAKSFALRIKPTLLDEATVARRIAVILHYATELGGLGAKTQNGFGQVQILDFPRFESHLEAGRAELRASAGSSTYSNGEFTIHPDRFFCVVYRIDGDPYANGRAVLAPPEAFDYSYIPCAFDLKPQLRATFGALNTDENFGYVQGQSARASRVHLSHLYLREPGGPYFLKIWGDLDEKSQALAATRTFVSNRFGAAASEEWYY